MTATNMCSNFGGFRCSSPSATFCLLPCFKKLLQQWPCYDTHWMSSKKSVDLTNQGQAPVVTVDQPLVILKSTQWKWPLVYREEKFVIMFGDSTLSHML